MLIELFLLVLIAFFWKDIPDLKLLLKFWKMLSKAKEEIGRVRSLQDLCNTQKKNEAISEKILLIYQCWKINNAFRLYKEHLFQRFITDMIDFSGVKLSGEQRKVVKCLRSSSEVRDYLLSISQNPFLTNIDFKRKKWYEVFDEVSQILKIFEKKTKQFFDTFEEYKIPEVKHCEIITKKNTTENKTTIQIDLIKSNWNSIVLVYILSNVSAKFSDYSWDILIKKCTKEPWWWHSKKLRILLVSNIFKKRNAELEKKLNLFQAFLIHSFLLHCNITKLNVVKKECDEVTFVESEDLTREMLEKNLDSFKFNEVPGSLILRIV